MEETKGTEVGSPTTPREGMPPVPPAPPAPEDLEGGGRGSQRAVVMDLASSAGVAEISKQSFHLPAEREAQLKAATFQDERWNNALRWLQGNGMMTREAALEIVEQGSQAFGFWRLHPRDVEGLVRQLTAQQGVVALGEPNAVSPALATWIESWKNFKEPAGTAVDKRPSRSTVARAPAGSAPSESWASASWAGLSRIEGLWLLLVLLFSNLWAMKVLLPGYQGALSVFGWPIYFARGCGMGTAILTGLLYSSMARGSLTLLSSYVTPGNATSCMLDAHKELHIFFGRLMGYFAAVHVLAHCLSTVVAIIQAHDSLAELADINQLLGCANPDRKDFWFWGKAHLLWPDCPITERYANVQDIMFTTTIGLSGVGLILLLVVIAYTAAQERRSKHFERFWYTHNAALVLWPVLMYVHGANAWVGVGVPLVIFTSAVPLLAYVADRLLRLARYQMYSKMECSIRAAVVRPGRKLGKEVMEGSMVHLKVERPPRLWNFRPGMYAFICMPEFDRWQWHPFTICSGEQDESVGFIIAAVGDWTTELARRVSKAKEAGAGDDEQMRRLLPRLALDGPYSAPTQTALANGVLVVVGAGVGITPFLSLMSTVVYRVGAMRRSHSNLSTGSSFSRRGELPMKHAHFFWMTRSADEFLFAKSLLTDIVDSRELHGMISIHLHVTAKEPAKDAKAFLFREALRRQSQHDLRRFKEVTSGAADLKPGAELPAAPLCPVGWLHGDNQDVLWVESILLGARPGAARPAAAALPIVFGRPNFDKEVSAIGRAHPQDDICIYICGNDAIVKNLQEVAKQCNDDAGASLKPGSRRQRFEVHYERFG